LLYLAILKDIAPYLATPLTGLARELRRENCQAILCQEYEYPRFDACVLLGQLMRLPVFGTFQGGNWQMSRLEKPLRPMTLWAGAGSIVATQTEVERVRNKYGLPAAKLARIFNPLDLAMWEPIDRNEARAALGIPEGARVVVYHGRIELQPKGLDVLVDAWLQVCSDRPRRDLRLLLVGMGSDADELRRLIAAKQLQGVI
jgi:starch synthase